MKTNICFSAHENSDIDVTSFGFRDVNNAFLLYGQDPDLPYGGHAKIAGVDFINVNRKYAADKSSFLTIDGKTAKGSDVFLVDELLNN